MIFKNLKSKVEETKKMILGENLTNKEKRELFWHLRSEGLFGKGEPYECK